MEKITFIIGYILICLAVFALTIAFVFSIRLFIIAQYEYVPFGDIVCKSEELYNLNTLEYIAEIFFLAAKIFLFGLVNGYVITRAYFDEINKRRTKNEVHKARNADLR